MKIRELFDSSEKWTKGFIARTRDGDPIFPNDERACSWCLMGAIEKCYLIPFGELEDGTIVMQKIQAKVGKQFMAWNDATERTFEEIKALVDELDI